jgi:DNA polymerase
MRAALTALTDELKRLKASGVKSIAVSEQALAELRRQVTSRSGRDAGVAAPVRDNQPTSKPEAIPPTANLATPSAKTAPTARELAASPSSGRTETPATLPASAAANLVTVPKLPAPPVVTLPEGDKQTRWDALLALVTSDPVCKQQIRPGKKVVLGVGDLNARIFFCGEAPGAEEEVQGEPFVGPAGQLLTKMIQAMGLKRSDVYIGNIMNWRPDLPTSSGQAQIGNRPPTEEEITYCLPYLRAQLEIVNPDVVVALGSTAAQGLFGYGSFKTLGEIRGRWKPFAEKQVMVTYHPSYILRNPSNRSKRAIWEDLLKVMERVALPISEKQRAYFLDK